jgi:hypothetical protein
MLKMSFPEDHKGIGMLLNSSELVSIVHIPDVQLSAKTSSVFWENKTSAKGSHWPALELGNNCILEKKRLSPYQISCGCDTCML